MPEYLSAPRAIEFPTEGGLTAHAFFYPPANKDFTGPPDDARPPLIVMSHGGPTSAASAEFDLGIRYWTSRGFAVVDVNYGGSTGYGRAYRERLNGHVGRRRHDGLHQRRPVPGRVAARSTASGC